MLFPSILFFVRPRCRRSGGFQTILSVSHDNNGSRIVIARALPRSILLVPVRGGTSLQLRQRERTLRSLVIFDRLITGPSVVPGMQLSLRRNSRNLCVPGTLLTSYNIPRIAEIANSSGKKAPRFRQNGIAFSPERVYLIA